MPMLPIKFLTVHATATPEFDRRWTPERVEKCDVDRFGRKSYHLIVDLDGRLHRSLKDHELGAHVAKRNSGNIGLAYIGGMTADMKKAKDTRTQPQRQIMLAVVKTYIDRYPGIRILGHRDWSPDLDGDGVIEPNEWMKQCPCFDVHAWLKAEHVL